MVYPPPLLFRYENTQQQHNTLNKQFTIEPFY